MNKHLTLIRTFHDQFALSQPEPGANKSLNEMDIILHQALLMDGGSETFKAIKIGDMAQILEGLLSIAYYALQALTYKGADVMEQPVYWRQDGHMISIAKLLSEKITRCMSGEAVDYSALYCLCVHLTRHFVNADFDKAFALVHENNIAHREADGRLRAQKNVIQPVTKLPNSPDLSECLYE